MSSVSKLNKAKQKANRAERVSNEWRKQFLSMREQRDILKAKLDELLIIHTDKVKQFKHISEKLKESR